MHQYGTNNLDLEVKFAKLQTEVWELENENEALRNRLKELEDLIDKREEAELAYAHKLKTVRRKQDIWKLDIGRDVKHKDAHSLVSLLAEKEQRTAEYSEYKMRFSDHEVERLREEVAQQVRDLEPILRKSQRIETELQETRKAISHIKITRKFDEVYEQRDKIDELKESLRKHMKYHHYLKDKYRQCMDGEADEE